MFSKGVIIVKRGDNDGPVLGTKNLDVYSFEGVITFFCISTNVFVYFL